MLPEERGAGVGLNFSITWLGWVLQKLQIERESIMR